MSSCHSCRGRSTRKKPGRFRRSRGSAALDQLPLPHHPQHPLAVDRPSQPPPHERGDHPVAVGLVRQGLLDDRGLDRIRRRPPLRRRPRGRCPVDRLPADLQHTRHGRQGEAPRDQLARPGDAHVSLPAPQCFPRDLELVGLAPQRPLELADLAAQLLLAVALLLARQRLAAALEQLVAPRRSRASPRSRARGRPPSPSGRRATRPARSRASAAPSSSGTSVCSLNPISSLVERPILSGPPDDLSGATPLQDRPATNPSGCQHGTGEQGNRGVEFGGGGSNSCPA